MDSKHRILAAVGIILIAVDLTSGHLNLYLNDTETTRLLGIEGELYYVRNGELSRYAMTFNMPIKRGIDDLYFTWQNLKPSPDPPMLYTLRASHTNPHAMEVPHVSIADRGTVPVTEKYFRVTLPCTGMMTADVDVTISLNVTMFTASDVTTMKFFRRKTCYEGEFPDILYKAGEIHTLQNVSYIVAEDESSIKAFLSNSTNILYLTIGAACALVIFIVVSVIIYYCCCNKSTRRDRKKPCKRPIQNMYSPYMQKNEVSTHAYSHSGQTYLRPDTPSNILSGIPTLRRALTPVSDIAPYEVRNRLSELRVERNHITLKDVIMEGTFGRVYSGILMTDHEHEVFVKTVTNQARPDQVETMLRECCLLKGFCFLNILPVLGVCLENEIQPLIIYNYSSEDNLKNFLQRCKMSALSTQQVLYMCLHLVRGVQYLHKKRVVHRDIAARNCVIDNQLNVKITDSALSRDLFPNEYHCLGDNENRPVKWLAIEALLDRRFTPASDAWAFSVTMWEILTSGQLPYSEVDPFDMGSYLKGGYRLAQPHNCSDEVFSMMCCCWSLVPEDRPHISQILAALQDFYSASGRFI